MDHHVHEDPARTGYIRRRGRGRIPGGNLDKLHCSQISCLDEFPNPLKVMIKTAVKAYLEGNPCFFHRGQGCLYPGNRQVYGLFTEDMLSCSGGGDDYICMGMGSAANYHPINGGISQDIPGIPGKEPHPQGFGPGFLFLR
ncbi:hypothetical protein Holit_02392 [Hollandina sp. SP2]